MTTYANSAPDIDRFEDLSNSLVKPELGIIPGDTFAIATAPDKCLMLRVDDNGNFLGKNKTTIDLTPFFEIIVFCKNWQVTSTRNGAGANLQILKTQSNVIEQDYLVWGKIIKPPTDGWCEIADARIGTIDVPAPAGAKIGDHLKLTAVEHLNSDSHGNMIITGQQLTGIEVLS